MGQGSDLRLGIALFLNVGPVETAECLLESKDKLASLFGFAELDVSSGFCRLHCAAYTEPAHVLKNVLLERSAPAAAAYAHVTGASEPRKAAWLKPRASWKKGMSVHAR